MQILISGAWQIRRGGIARQLFEQGQLPIKTGAILAHQFGVIVVVLRIEKSIFQWTAGGAWAALQILLRAFDREHEHSAPAHALQPHGDDGSPDLIGVDQDHRGVTNYKIAIDILQQVPAWHLQKVLTKLLPQVPCSWVSW